MDGGTFRSFNYRFHLLHFLTPSPARPPTFVPCPLSSLVPRDCLCLFVPCLVYSSETSVKFYVTTWHHLLKRLLINGVGGGLWSGFTEPHERDRYEGGGRRLALLEKPPVVQLLKNFPTLYGTRKFITMFRRTLHWSVSWARSIQSIPPHPISVRSILILSKPPTCS
jgi:hypothetical protein